MFLPILSIIGALSFSASQYMQTDYQDTAYCDDSSIDITPLPVAYFDIYYNFGYYQDRGNNNFELDIGLTYEPYSVPQYLSFNGGYVDNNGSAGVSWYDLTIPYYSYVKCYALYSGSSRLMFEGSFDLMSEPDNAGGKSFEWSGGNPNYYGDLLGYSFHFTMFQYSQEVYNAYNNIDINISDSYRKGYEEGQQHPSQEVYDDIFKAGKDEGYSNGVEYGLSISNQGSALTIFSGILDIGLLPINIFLAMLNFEVFGINIGGFIMGLLTIAVTIWLLKIFMSGSGSGGSSK